MNIEIAFHRENTTKLFDEIMPLFEQHFAEIYTPDYPDFEIKPDFGLYEYLEKKDVYRAFTVRTVHGKLVGYAGFFLKDHPHTGVKQATQDLCFIAPEFRGNGEAFFAFCEEQLSEAGAQVILQMVTPHLDFSSMLKRNGYRLQETVYAKRLI